MANDKIGSAEGQEPAQQSRRTAEPVSVAILVGVVVLIVIAALNFYETRRQRSEFADRITQVLNGVKTRPAADSANPANPAPQPAGPEPDKVYTVKTQGAPVRGANAAPIKIAEFSDFQ